MTSIKSNGYTIHIGDEIFKTLKTFLGKNNYSSFFILCDENTLQHCLPTLITSCPKLSTAEILEIESGETGKSIEFCVHIWNTLTELKADKKTLLINLGGGVVSDLGGFTASVYKRGIDFINIPTSLLAMADASVGGKTGIDFGDHKNLIGTFTQPKAVFIYTEFLKTLEERHFQNGLAEIYKMGLVCDKKFWGLLKDSVPVKELITKSVTLKNKIVLKDPFDKGVRNILNFGHTIGHAIETLQLGTKNELLHGEAVMVGMILESHISFQKKKLSKKELTEIAEEFKYSFLLPSLDTISLNDIVEKIRNDKKSVNGKLLFSLIDKIGACKINVEVSKPQVKNALAYYNTLISK